MTLTLPLSEYDIFAGIDVDAKSYCVTYQDHRQKGRSFKMSASSPQLHQYFQKHFPGKRVVYAYEAGGTGYSLYDYLTSQNQSCMIVHPPSIQKAPKDRVKTNRIDSQRLSDQLRSGELAGIRVPSEPYRHLRHLVELRQQYVRACTQTKQRIKSLLLYENIPLPEDVGSRNWSGRFLHALSQVPLKPIPRLKLDALLEDLHHAKGRLLWSVRQLRQFCFQDEEIRKSMSCLRSLPGVGFAVSTYLLARIGDPSHLRKLNELGSFAGLVPTERSTGDSIQRGPITHLGDRTLRCLLIEAAWIAIRQDTELAEFYHRIRSKHWGDHGARIAITAVARKLTHRIYRVLKDQRPYQRH